MAKYNWSNKIMPNRAHHISIVVGRADRIGMVWVCSGRTSAYDVIG